MSRMRLPLSLLAATALLAACTSGTDTQNTQNASASRDSMASSPMMAMKTYTNAAAGYSIDQPKDWTVKENATLRTRPVAGTTITPPASYARETMLLNAVVFIEKTGGACPDNGSRITLGGNEFLQTNARDASKPTIVDTETFSTTKNGVCYSLILQTNTCTPNNNCDEMHSKVFDRSDLIRTFRSMVSTFKVN